MSAPGKVLVAGATGYIGRAVVRTLVAAGYEVIAAARPRAGIGGAMDQDATRAALVGAEVRFGDITDPEAVRDAIVRGDRFDAAISCLASRTGAVQDAWRIDHEANRGLLEATRAAGLGHFVLLSAICVQRPRLAFQHAKLAFEADLISSGVAYSIVRPTAFFKSLSGQLAGLEKGKRFVMFGDGEGTACKPISERDLARFTEECLRDPARQNAILPIGGPGEAITPRAQGELLFELLGAAPRFRRVPLALMDAIVAGLGLAARLVPAWADKAEFARTGHYYATESMLVWDDAARRYDAEATPSFGQDTLRDFYAHALEHGLEGQELGDHAVF